MHVFLTGSTGWIGNSLTKQLLRAGHQVTGLVRDASKAKPLIDRGLKPLIGTLDELHKLRTGASDADAVVHLAFNHDFSQFAENAKQDRRAIEAMGQALAGSERPMLVTTGLLGLPIRAKESDKVQPGTIRQSEDAALGLAAQGIRISTVRLPPTVHGLGEHGFLSIVIAAARQHGVSGFLQDGSNCWAAIHRDDAARIYLLALERGARDAVYHAVAESAVPFFDIAAVVGRRLGLPSRAVQAEHFGWFAKIAGEDLSATNQHTRNILGWSPEQPGLLADLDQPDYFQK